MRYFIDLIESASAPPTFPIPVTPLSVEKAKTFVMRKWKERAQERGLPEPQDLSSSCKFSSLFVQQVFGGALKGNEDHQFVMTPSGMIDLSDDSADVRELGSRAHRHDPVFFGNRDHRASMRSCKPRVDAWVKEFAAELAAEPITEEAELLTEMDWYEKSAMAVHLKRYVGQNVFIHFTNGAPNRHVDSENSDKMASINVASTPRERARARKMNGTARVPKIGVNPSAGLNRAGRNFRPVSTHGDPIGVYFYPVDFLFTASDRLRRGGQFGLNFNYYYVCRIDKSGGGIDLAHLSMEGIAKLAQANGWLDKWEEFMAKPEEERLQILGLAFKKEKGVGSFFWAFMQRVMHAENLGWNKLLKTVTYIEDPGLGIIHSHEPAQIVALRPNIIRIIEQGETEPNRKPDQPAHQDTRIEWEFAMKNLFKRLRGEYGGEITFKNKEPTLVFKAGSAEFTCLGRYERGPTLHVTYQQGRATGSVYMDASRFSSKTAEEIVEDLQKVVTRVARRKSDLVFEPSISIDDAVKVLTRAFGQAPTRVETEIRNEASQINITAEIDAGTDRINTMGRLNLRIRPDELSLTGTVEINNKPILSIYAPNHDEYPTSQIDKMLSDVAENLAKALKETSRTYLGDHNRRYNGVFDSPEEFNAFVGWFATHGGFDFNGKLKEVLADEVAQFEATDKSALESQMGWAFGGR